MNAANPIYGVSDGTISTYVLSVGGVPVLTITGEIDRVQLLARTCREWINRATASSVTLSNRPVEGLTLHLCAETSTAYTDVAMKNQISNSAWNRDEGIGKFARAHYFRV